MSKITPITDLSADIPASPLDAELNSHVKTARSEALEAALGHIPVDFRQAKLLPAIRAHLGAGGPLNVLLVGPPGTGKSRQCWGMVAHAIRARHSRLGEAVFIGGIVYGPTGPPRQESTSDVAERIGRRLYSEVPIDLISESGDIMRHRHDREWVDQIAAYDGWLIVDDIGFAERPGEWAQECAYHIANERRAWHRKTLWTTNRRPDQLREAYGEATASRLFGGAVIEMGGQDRRLA